MYDREPGGGGGRGGGVVHLSGSRVGPRRDGDRYPRPLKDPRDRRGAARVFLDEVTSSARMLIGSRGREHVSGGGKQL